jgi:hypothetical protein
VASLPARALGVITSPRTTFAHVIGAPKWWGVLLLTTLVIFGCSAVVLRTEVGRMALVDQWERTTIAFGGTVSDAQYTRLLDLSQYGIAYAALTSLLNGPVLVFVLAGILTFMARAAFRADVTFRQLLAVVAHAGVILMLRQVVAAPAHYLSESLSSPTTMIRLAGTLDESSPLARFLGAVDLFVIWWIVVLAVGVAAAVRRPVRPVAVAFAGIYVALAILLAVAMAFTGGTA